MTVTQDVIPLAEPWFPPDCAEAVKRQVASTFVGPGKAAQRFAARLADICGVAAAVPVASGTVALGIAARTVGLHPGDEVVIPAYGVPPVINAFASAGFIPRLADVRRSTGCLDPDLLEEAITPRTRAVCFVDYCGSIDPDLGQVEKICQNRGIPLIEDAAWALGRKSGARRGGGSGTIGAMSFSVPKLITTGQGGAVLTQSDDDRHKAASLVDHGDPNWRHSGITTGIGSNLRLSDLAAALGLAQLNDLDERIARKRRSFAIIRGILGERLFRTTDGDHAAQNIIFVDRRDEAIATLRAMGIMAMSYFAYYQHPPYAELERRIFTGAEFWSNHAVHLPWGVGMTEEDAERVGNAVLDLDGMFL